MMLSAMAKAGITLEPTRASAPTLAWLAPPGTSVRSTKRGG